MSAAKSAVTADNFIATVCAGCERKLKPRHQVGILAFTPRADVGGDVVYALCLHCLHKFQAGCVETIGKIDRHLLVRHPHLMAGAKSVGGVQ